MGRRGSGRAVKHCALLITSQVQHRHKINSWETFLEPLTFGWREKLLLCFLDHGAEVTLTMAGTDTNGQDLVSWCRRQHATSYLVFILSYNMQHSSFTAQHSDLEMMFFRLFSSEKVNFPARFDNCSVEIIAKFWHKTVQILQVCWSG